MLFHSIRKELRYEFLPLLKSRRGGAAGPGRPLRVDLRIPFAACAVEGFLLLGLYTLLTYRLPRLTLLGLVFLGVYALSVGVTFTAFAWRLSRSRRNIRTAELLTADIYRMFPLGHGYSLRRHQRGQPRARHQCRHAEHPRRAVAGVRPAALGNMPRRHAGTAARRPAQPRRRGTAGSAQRPAPGGRGGRHRLGHGHAGGRYSATAWSRTCSASRRTPTLLLLFRDVNDYLNFVEETDRNRVVLAYIVLDNLQELTQFVRANYRATANIIEETLTGWVASMHGMIREYDRDKYLALFSEEMLDRCVQDNFSILGKIMNIRVGDNTFPLSVSMGIADIDGSMEERDRAANAALDMALQRGGNRSRSSAGASPG